MIFNTEDRKEKLQKLRSIVGGFDSEEVYCDKNTSAIDTSS